jgi:hypothetical protein
MSAPTGRQRVPVTRRPPGYPRRTRRRRARWVCRAMYRIESGRKPVHPVITPSPPICSGGVSAVRAARGGGAASRFSGVYRPVPGAAAGLAEAASRTGPTGWPAPKEATCPRVHGALARRPSLAARPLRGLGAQDLSGGGGCVGARERPALSRSVACSGPCGPRRSTMVAPRVGPSMRRTAGPTGSSAGRPWSKLGAAGWGLVMERTVVRPLLGDLEAAFPGAPLQFAGGSCQPAEAAAVEHCWGGRGCVR